MRIAGGDLSSYQQIVALRNRNPPSVIDYGMIVKSVISKWNDQAPNRRLSTVRSMVAHIVGDRRGRVDRWIRANIDPDNRDPLSFLTGGPSRWVMEDLLIGRAHGDLNGRNILICTDPTVRTDDFQLIDYDHYSENAPLARDPMHLLVALALDDFTKFNHEPSARQDLIKVIVDPNRTDVADSVQYFSTISRTIHSAVVDALSDGGGGLGKEWRQQCLLALVGDALLRVGRKAADDRPEESRRWCYDLAVAAAARFRDRYGDEFASQTVALPPRGGIVNRFFQQDALADRFTHGPYGVLSVQGETGAGKTKLVDAVIKTLQAQDDSSRRPRFGQRHVTPDYRLDVATLIELIGGEPAPAGGRPGAALVRLEKILNTSSGPIVIVVEAAENLLHPNAHRLVDLGLDEAFTMLNAHEAHQVSVVLETIEGESLEKAVSWPAADTITVPALSTEEFLDLLRSMDRDDRLRLGRLSGDEQLELAQHAAGVPRIGELMYATVCQANVPLSTILAELPAHTSAPAYLIQTLLDDRTLVSQVITALAVFGTPVPVLAVQAALPGVSPGKARQMLVNLHADHLVRCDGDLYYLPAADAATVLDQTAPDVLRSMSYACTKALQDCLVHTPRTLSDLRYHFAQLRIVLRTEDFPFAHRLISVIDNHLQNWRCNALLLEQRLAVRGRYGNSELERVNENALGGIYLTLGDVEEADVAYGQARSLAGPQTDARDIGRQQVNLGNLHLAMNNIDMARVNYEYGLAEATKAGDSIGRMGALTGLADCHRRWGQFAEAIECARKGFRVYGTQEFVDHDDAVTDGPLLGVALAARLSYWHAELGKTEPAWHWLQKILSMHGSNNASHRATYLDTRADLLLFEGLRSGTVDRAIEEAGQAIDLAFDVQDRATLRQARMTLCVAHLRAGRPAEAKTAITRASWHRSRGQNLVVPALAALVCRITKPASAEELFRDLLQETDDRIRKDTDSWSAPDAKPLAPRPGDFVARHIQGFARCGLVLAGRVDLAAAIESFEMPGMKRPEPAPGLNYRMEFMLTRLDETGPRRGLLQPVIDALNR